MQQLNTARQAGPVVAPSIAPTPVAQAPVSWPAPANGDVAGGRDSYGNAGGYGAGLYSSDPYVSNTVPVLRPPEGVIWFYERHEAYYEFTNFWPCSSLLIDGLTWPTTEHFFQGSKFFRDAHRRDAVRLALA